MNSGESLLMTYIFCQSELLLYLEAICLVVLCVADIGASPALVLQSLHLVVDVLLLIHGLVYDGLRDAPSPSLLLVVVERGVDSSLLARPHVRSSIFSSALL